MVRFELISRSDIATSLWSDGYVVVNGNRLSMSCEKNGFLLKYHAQGAAPFLRDAKVVAYDGISGMTDRCDGPTDVMDSAFRFDEAHGGNPILWIKLRIQDSSYSLNQAMLSRYDAIVLKGDLVFPPCSDDRAATNESCTLPRDLVNSLDAFAGEAFVQDSFTNLVVQVGEQEFHVHAGILLARSAVFRTMLCTDMSEKKERRLVIKDVEPGVVKKFLFKVYDLAYEIGVDSVAELSDLTKLFHMYELKDGVEECKKLLSEMTSDNVADLCTILQISHLYEFKGIFEQAVAKLRGLRTDDEVWERPEFLALSPSVLLAALKLK